MPQSVPGLLRESAERYAARPVLYRRLADKTVGHETYADLRAAVDRAAAGLVASGVMPGDHVVLLSENRREWVVADLAIQSVGAVTVPLYPSLPAPQVQPLISRVRAKVVILDDHRQLTKLDTCLFELPLVEQVWVFDSAKIPADHPLARDWTVLEAQGTERIAELLPEVDRRIAALGAHSPATIIFTSGTTGVPKGAVLTHGNFVTNVDTSQRRIALYDTDRLLAVLPLSHVFQRMITYLGLSVGAGCLFNESLRHMLPDMLALRPTIMIMVPRMLEMLRDKVLSGARDKQGLAGTIAGWAMGLAPLIGQRYQDGKPQGAWMSLQQSLAEQRVYSAVREQLGLDQLRFAVSGGAALPVDVSRWFHGVGMRVIQGYGLTETSPVVAVNPSEGRYRFETIGPPVDLVEVHIAPDGELWTRGPCNMAGYFEMPEETAEAIDADGWFHTGDLAAQDADGHIRIVGRKKEIMVLASGKNVAPVPIEATLGESPLIERCVVFADGQHVVSALVVPAFDALWEVVAKSAGTPERDEQNTWVTCDAAAQAVRAEIDRLSDALAPFERVRRFRLLTRDFSLEHEEVTPTMKLRRSIIAEHFADLIREMAE